MFRVAVIFLLASSAVAAPVPKELKGVNMLTWLDYDPKTSADAVNDALQSIRLVRAHAAEWKIDPSSSVTI